MEVGRPTMGKQERNSSSFIAKETTNFERDFWHIQA